MTLVEEKEVAEPASAPAEINEHAPPASCEEAAALLGAAILSFDTPMLSTSSSSTTTGHTNPPQGMHSIFTVQQTIPNQVLFIRLCNLRAWLRWHASALDDPPHPPNDMKPQLGISFPHTKQSSKEPFNAARSILAVLMKLLEASSNIASGGDGSGAEHIDPTSKVVKSLTSPHQKQRKQNNKNASNLSHNKHTKQHKQLPPLLSTPLRNIWVECISLCLALGCSLPGNLRTDVNNVMGKMIEIAGWNPRSKMAAGGVRLATLQVLGQVCIVNTDLAKRAATYSWEILQCCHKGLLSGGAGEPGHRAACVKTACRLMVACRRAADSSPMAASSSRGGGSESFTSPGSLEERVAVEAIKFIKRATSDKYPEVRIGAALFAGLAAPMLIRIVPPSRSQRGGSGRDGDVNPLSWLEDITHIAMRNIDDESAGVATAWSTTLARCLCASSEHGASIRTAQSEEQASNRSADVDDEAVATSSIDFAKFKAFGGRATAATASCSSVPATIVYLVSLFVKTGGETASNRCGGSHSIGGRASRIGYADALTEFLRLQAAKGDFTLTEALDPVLEMVGEAFEKQISKKEGLHNQMDFYAPSSPRSPHEKKPPGSNMFLARNSKANSTADSSIGRILASNVLRCGISENLSEMSQLMILRSLTSACRSSIGSTSADGGTVPRPVSEVGIKQCNRHQLQCALIEISHLIVGLGEACASSLEDLLPVLRDCLSYPDHGVRHEAAAVYAAIAQAFSSEARTFVIDSLGSFAANLDAIQSLSSRVASTTIPVQRRRFGGRSNTDKHDGPTDELMKHQSTLHGNGLAVSMLMHEFPHIMGGCATVIVSKVFDVIGRLLQCQFNDSFVKSNPSAACTCIRAGYCMLSGALSMGLDAVVPNHVTTVFTFWQSSSMNMLPGVSKFSSSHDLLWLETMLGSIVSFLKFSPELLLAVPDALTRLTALLEKVFPLISSGGRFEREANDPVGSARLSSARSSVMEAYSWLPPGSFPLSADRIFSFAASQIQELSGTDVLCSLLEILVSSEDKLIEAHSVERAVGPGQIGGSVTLDNNISIRSSDIVHHNEREAVLHLLAWRRMFSMRTHDNILSLFLREGGENSIPTPLHDVGTWRTPPDPIGTSKVRLLDSSIHVFAATFGLQDGHTQSESLKMLEAVYLQKQNEKTNRFNVNASLILESQGKVKPQEEDIPASNVIATILACLQALPLHESTHGTFVDRGPPWMERATSLLLRLLPSPSGIIRRGAAEGLSLLATLGVSEDAHTLQSTILHSLDEVMKGANNSTVNPKNPGEIITYAKAGSLLTLACVQRGAERMKKSEEERDALRSVSREVDNSDSDKTPVMIMMTRLLPSLATHKLEEDSIVTRTYALHSFGVLISNSIATDTSLSKDQVQIVWKAVESVETSFLSAWSAVVSDISKGREREKFQMEPAFLAVLLRLMTTLLPWLRDLKDIDRWLASRFSCYASAILEFSDNHPLIIFEGAVFFERLSKYKDLVGTMSSCVAMTDNVTATAMPFLVSVVQPSRSKVVATSALDFSGCQCPIDGGRSVILCLKEMCSTTTSCDDSFTLGVGKVLFAYLHDRCGRRRFQHFPSFRSLALSRAVVSFFADYQMVETELIALLQDILKAQIAGREKKEKSFIILQWLLFSRCLASGDAKTSSNDVESDLSIPTVIETARLAARIDALQVLKYSNTPRWQLKCISANMAAIAMMMLLDIDECSSVSESIFNLKAAESRCIEMLKKKDIAHGVEVHSQVAFHLEELIKTACSISTSTSNHSELPSVQISGLRLLVSLFHAFGRQPDPSNNDGTSILEQYSSQIISSVKHALNSETLVNESIPGTAFHRLFSAGCDALDVMISENLISDPVATRRLLQPVLLTAEEVPFVQYPSENGNGSDALLMKSSRVTDDSRSYPLFKLSKLCFLAKTSMLIALGRINKSDVIDGELSKEETGRAIHCLASAIDGFLLQEASEQEQSPSCSSSLTYKNLADLDESVIETLVRSWPTLAASATLSIIKALKAADNNGEGRDDLKQWLGKLTPVLVSGLRHSLTSTCSLELPDSETAALVYATRLLVSEHEVVGKVICSTELGGLANLVTDSIIFNSLGLSDSKGEGITPSPCKGHNILIEQSCGLIEDLCQHHCAIDVDASILTRSIVTPLVALQETRMTLFDNQLIISSCVRSSQSLLESCQEEEGRAEFEKASVQLVLALLNNDFGELNESTKTACLSLLRVCCGNSMMTREEWGKIATFTASKGLWGAWAVICASLPPGYGIKCSINAIKASLTDLQSGPRHTTSLVALRTALHAASAQDPSLICVVLQSVGYEILQLLKAHGIRILSGQGFDENRATVCAEAIKVNLMAYQYLISVSAEDESNSISFISALFEVLVENIRFNGLPNHSSGKVGADESIGRMCAQVFVHVARSSPIVFKSTMAVISQESRVVLEGAVRADMSGYAAPQKQKKKISLKGFVR